MPAVKEVSRLAAIAAASQRHSAVHVDSRKGTQAQRGKLMPGRPANPQPLDRNSTVVRLQGCPDCKGRGWFLINPFATGGSNGAGGIGNMCQCETCLSAKQYWDQHGALPPELAHLWPHNPPASAETSRDAQSRGSS